MSELEEAILFIEGVKECTPHADKATVEREFVRQFGPQRRRSLFLGHGYSMRFSQASGNAFSNTVLSLSALQGVDDEPVVVCIVSPAGVRFLLANSTFLKKASHSSRDLRVDNVRGSFNGSDIMRQYGQLANAPANFSELYALHQAWSWEDNLERLVSDTRRISPRATPYHATDSECQCILSAPERMKDLLGSPEFRRLEEDLRSSVAELRAEILQVARIENVNLRGNRIEELLTGQTASHELGDLRREIGGGTLAIDVKTKLIDRTSAPKAYNVDKMLEFHADPTSFFAFLVIGLDVGAEAVAVRLVPVLDETIVASTIIQHHWAGRRSRGVAQLTSSFALALAPIYQPRIEVQSAKAFLLRLLVEPL